jgi:hypothetical protein
VLLKEWVQYGFDDIYLYYCDEKEKLNEEE